MAPKTAPVGHGIHAPGIIIFLGHLKCLSWHVRFNSCFLNLVT
jgi:hypothetical protein